MGIVDELDESCREELPTEPAHAISVDRLAQRLDDKPAGQDGVGVILDDELQDSVTVHFSAGVRNHNGQTWLILSRDAKGAFEPADERRIRYRSQFAAAVGAEM